MSQTFAMIKPSCVADGVVGEILSMIEKKFKIQKLMMTTLTLDQVREFYIEHKERPFYESMCDAIANQKVVAMILEADNAVAEFRALIGSTNPKDSAEGTIRHLYGKDIENNAVHGSDSNESFVRECEIIFKELSNNT